jgi:hypothetical protein
MIHKCPNCRQPVAKEDRRRRWPNSMTPAAGVTMSEPARDQAPKFRCSCGKAVILMKGKL